jgi:NAD(P)H-dependent FMN reductase
MASKILVFYGSYRIDRKGIRLANFVMSRLTARGEDVELIDAKAVDLPMLDRMYKEYRPGTAPEPMETLANKIKAADAFVFVTGEYNWGVQPGLKNLTDHFLEEWFWRPAAIASYSAGRFSGVRSSLAWHSILSEMGIAVISSTLAVGPIDQTLDERTDRQLRGSVDPSISEFRGRSSLVGGGGKSAAFTQGAAVLKPKVVATTSRVD